MNVFNFSGGRTSAYMTLKYYKEGDLVLFCDTGREVKQTYEFIDNFEKNEGIEIIRLKYSENPFEDFLKKQKYIPNQAKRLCTIELKVKTARRYLVSKKIHSYNNYIGFRYDEPLRVKRRKSYWKKVFDKFPLYDEKIIKTDINKFWESKNYNLEIPSILSNCDLCFMKGKSNIISILKEFPEYAEKWIKDEKKYGNTYFKECSYEELLKLSQNNLFKNQNLNELQPAFNCACTS